MRIFTLFIASLLVFHLKIKAQDSVRYGRYFIGIDASPFTFLVTGLKKPDLVLQFKMVSRQNPCIRYRVVYSRFYRENKNLLYVVEGNSNQNIEGYPAALNSTGSYRLSTIGAGMERVLPFRKINFIVGSDLVVGTRIENETTFLTDFAGPDSVLYNKIENNLYGSWVETFITGLTPFAGIETEIGERFSFQASIRGLIGFNSLLSSHRNSYSSMRSVGSKSEVHFTGLNLLFYYRF